jgi:serine/threonine protein kinase
MVSVGDVVDGRYRLIRLVGGGGFGHVYEGSDLRLGNRPVAVKLLDRSMPHEADAPRRFEQEASLLARLDEHDNLVRIIDKGSFHAIPYIVMSFVDGETLAEKLRREKYLPLDEASVYAYEIAVALDFGFTTANMVHRDVKPGNILLRRRDGRALLADLGIAKVLDLTLESNNTIPIGTKEYMAPEQFDGEVCRQTDIYSLACVVFEMLTGTPPYTGTPAQVMKAHRENHIPSLVERSYGRVPGMVHLTRQTW